MVMDSISWPSLLDELSNTSLEVSTEAAVAQHQRHHTKEQAEALLQELGGSETVLGSPDSASDHQLSGTDSTTAEPNHLPVSFSYSTSLPFSNEAILSTTQSLRISSPSSPLSRCSPQAEQVSPPVLINGLTSEELINSIRFEFDQEGSPGYYGPREYERDQERKRLAQMTKKWAKEQEQRQQASNGSISTEKSKGSMLFSSSLSRSLPSLPRSLSSKSLFRSESSNGGDGGCGSVDSSDRMREDTRNETVIKVASKTATTTTSTNISLLNPSLAFSTLPGKSASARRDDTAILNVIQLWNRQKVARFSTPTSTLIAAADAFTPQGSAPVQKDDDGNVTVRDFYTASSLSTMSSTHTSASPSSPSSSTAQLPNQIRVRSSHMLSQSPQDMGHDVNVIPTTVTLATTASYTATNSPAGFPSRIAYDNVQSNILTSVPARTINASGRNATGEQSFEGLSGPDPVVKLTNAEEKLQAEIKKTKWLIAEGREEYEHYTNEIATLARYMQTLKVMQAQRRQQRNSLEQEIEAIERQCRRTSAQSEHARCGARAFTTGDCSSIAMDLTMNKNTRPTTPSLSSFTPFWARSSVPDLGAPVGSTSTCSSTSLSSSSIMCTICRQQAALIWKQALVDELKKDLEKIQKSITYKGSMIKQMHRTFVTSIVQHLQGDQAELVRLMEQKAGEDRKKTKGKKK
ncbi:hypothetical protein EDD11_009410 [Mortierella claussenii]|nr:hypothetical protein EDD11_009410 [Mortierella claussenii]